MFYKPREVIKYCLNIQKVKGGNIETEEATFCLFAFVSNEKYISKVAKQI